MSIKKQTKVTAAEKSTSLHGGNGGKVEVPKAAQDLLNSDSADRLIDLEDDFSGSTHFPIVPGKEGKEDGGLLKKIQAATTPTGEQNISTLDNDTDPAAGYLPGAGEVTAPVEQTETPSAVSEAAVPGATEDAPTTDMALEVDAADENLELVNNNAPEEIFADDDVEEIEDEAEEQAEDDLGDDDDYWDDPVDGTDDDVEVEEVEEVEAGDEDSDDEEFAEEEVEVDSELPLLDIDGVDDAAEDIGFATAGAKVLVIRANRIVASLNKKQAVKAGVQDVYLTRQFETVVASEIKEHGLRKGLTGTGFVLAKVNVGASQVVAKLVEKEVHKTTAAIRSNTAEKASVMEQSLAIAAVGINRKGFKNVENPLMAALESELKSAGVRGASKLLAAVFAEHGPAYTKSVLALANQIAAQPEVVRDSYASMFDMTEVSASDDLDEAEFETEEFDDEFDEDVEDINSLETAGVRVQAHVQPTNSRNSKAVLLKASLSSRALDVLGGKVSF